MKISASALVAVVLAANVLSPSAFAQDRRNAAPTVDWMTQRPAAFSMVLQIERNPQRGDRTTDARMAAAVCESTAVVDPVLTGVTNLPLNEARQLVIVAAEASNESFVTITVMLSPKATQQLAEGTGTKILDELSKQAITVLTKSADVQLASVRAQKDSLQERLKNSEEKLAAAELKYKDVAARVDPTEGGYGNNKFGMRANLQQQRNQIAQQFAGQKAKLLSLESNAPATRPEETSSASLSQQLVAAREKRVNDTRDAIAAGKKTADDLESAQQQLLEAKLMYAISQQYLRSSSAESRQRDNLVSLRSSVAELEAQLVVLDEQLAVLPTPTTMPADTISQNDLQMINNERQEIRNRVQSLRQQLENFDSQFGPLKAPTITPLTSEKAE